MTLTLTPRRGSRGGNRHPIAVKQFILDHLTAVGEDYVSSMHRAYKDALRKMARERRRKYEYHTPVFASFHRKVRELIDGGFIEFSGREEPSGGVTLRRYYRLARRR